MRDRVHRLTGRFLPALCLAALLAYLAAPASAYGLSRETAKALDYLHARQQADGGFAEPGGASSEDVSCWAVVAISATGEDARLWKQGSGDPLTYLTKQIKGWKMADKSPTDLARAVLAVKAGNGNPAAAGGRNLVTALKGKFGGGGDIGNAVNSTAWAVLALKAAGYSPPASGKTRDWLIAVRHSSGGWGIAKASAPDSNDTAAVIQALRALGVAANAGVIKGGISYLGKQQQADGGISYGSYPPDCASDAWAVQALIAAGKHPTYLEKNGRDALSHLKSLQRTDGGFDHSESDSNRVAWMTCQSLPALAGKAFPFSPGKAQPASPLPFIDSSYPLDGGDSDSDVFSISLRDMGTGIEPASLKLSLDGKPVPASAMSISGGLIQGQAPNGTGGHKFLIAVSDKAGNKTELPISFTRQGGSPGAPIGAAAPSSAVSPSTAAAPSLAVSITSAYEATTPAAAPALRRPGAKSSRTGLDPRLALATGLLACAGLVGLIPLLRARRGTSKK